MFVLKKKLRKKLEDYKEVVRNRTDNEMIKRQMTKCDLQSTTQTTKD